MRLPWWRQEEGLATMEWIALTGVILVFLTVILVYFQADGGQQVAQAVSRSFQHQVQAWNRPLW